MTEVNSHDPSSISGNVTAGLTYVDTITRDMVLSGQVPEDAAISLGQGGELVRPFDVGFDEYGAPSFVCIDDRDDVIFLPINLVPGIDAIDPEKIERSNDEIIVAFQNYKQAMLGEPSGHFEGERRLLAVTSVGFGVQEGHRGHSATKDLPAVPPEHAGFYLHGYQIGTASLEDNLIELKEVGERNFSLYRTGAIGDPADARFRSTHNIY